MPELTRTFTVDELDDVMYSNNVLTEILEEDEGKTLRRLVFKLDGQAWEIHYRHHDDVGVYFDDDEVTATAVEERQVTITKWLPVETAEVTS